MATPAQTPDIFDQLAAGQNPVPAVQFQSQRQPVPVNAGPNDVFSQANTLTSPQPSRPVATIRPTPGSDPNDPMAAKISLWAHDLQNDLLYGGNRTGIGGLIRELGATPLTFGTNAGVQPKPAQSLNNVASNLSAAVKAKASALYKQLDQAIGGTRFQTFDEQLSNVRRALRNSAGIDPDADGRLIERINDLEDARAKAFEMAKQSGIDPNLIHSANAAHRQAMALEDVSKHIQASLSGLRSDLSQGVSAAAESLSPAKLAARANRLYNSGRLQQAVGESHADELLRTVESMKQRLQEAAQNAAAHTEQAIERAKQQSGAVNTRRVLAGAAAASVGVPKVWTVIKHLLGE